MTDPNGHRSHRELHDGAKEGLRPLESLDVANVDSFAALVRAMGKTAFQGRQLGNALDVLANMARDESCFSVLTLSGAMTVAKQGSIICELIERRVIDAVVSTGALMAHGLSEAVGLTHYAIDPEADDTELFDKGYNRVYDTIEMEANLNDVAEVVAKVLESVTPEDGIWSSARFCRAVGKYLHDQGHGRGILKSAYEKGVPVFIPAFTDSEIGLDFSTWAMKTELRNKIDAGVTLSTSEVFSAVPMYNPFLDLQEYARLCGNARTLGIFTIGGGVPRNWAQQVAPYCDITSARLNVPMPEPRFQYGVRICPEPAYWGGLSGCTYSEGVSWGKFVPQEEGGQFAEVRADATLVLPLLTKALFETLDN